VRRTTALTTAAAAVTGAVVAVLGVLTTRWWLLHHTAGGAATNLGWYAYSGTPRRYVDYLPTPAPAVDWWALLLPGALAGAALGLLIALAVLLLRRRRSVDA
jgi:hypothetical protein